MTPIIAPKLNALDRIKAWFSPSYGARVVAERFVQQYPHRVYNSRRGAEQPRTDRDWSGQPWGPDSIRTLTPAARRNMVLRARDIDENNILGSSLIDRAVDNIIGEKMVLQASSNDSAFNDRVESLWKEYEPDARGLLSQGDMQRAWYRAKVRDGDIGLHLLSDGTIQTIESDYVRSPYGAGDIGEKIIDGVELDVVGRPVRFHVRVAGLKPMQLQTVPVDAMNFVWYFENNRLDRKAIRGVPVMAMLGPMLDQIDGTIEAVVMAHRMAACFGLLRKQTAPGQVYSGLPTTATNAAGDAAPNISLEPAMVEFLGVNESVEQIKPEHPTSSFGEFMTFLIRIAGLKLGLPLELALLDFSKTNYSSARASMEQAYRRFRIEQQTFARRVLSKIYTWRVQKWIDGGELPNPPSDAFSHRWFGQAWPYLNPQDEAVGALVAVDAGFSTLTDELMKRGVEFDDWIKTRKRELDAMAEAGVPVSRASVTRDYVPSVDVADDAPPQPDLENESNGIEQAKIKADAYGVAVRAGAVTPQADDEASFREQLELPAMSSDVQAAWQRDEGTRRPITLTPPAGQQAAAPAPTINPDEETEQ